MIQVAKVLKDESATRLEMEALTSSFHYQVSEIMLIYHSVPVAAPEKAKFQHIMPARVLMQKILDQALNVVEACIGEQQNIMKATVNPVMVFMADHIVKLIATYILALTNGMLRTAKADIPDNYSELVASGRPDLMQEILNVSITNCADIVEQVDGHFPTSVSSFRAL